MTEVLEEGKEYSILESSDWSALTLRPGQVLEIFLPSTTLDDPPNCWACIIAMEVALCSRGGWDVRGKHIACGDAAMNLQLSAMFNRRVGWFHICTEAICSVEDDYVFHVQQLKVWSVAGVAVPYMSSYQQRQMGKWHQQVSGGGNAVPDIPVGGGDAVPGDASLQPSKKRSRIPKDGPVVGSSAKRPGALKGAGVTHRKPGAPLKPHISFADTPGHRDPTGDGAGTGEEATAELRARLAKAKQRLSGAGGVPPPGGHGKAAPVAEELFVDSSSISPSPSPLPERLGSGTMLPHLELLDSTGLEKDRAEVAPRKVTVKVEETTPVKKKKGKVKKAKKAAPSGALAILEPTSKEATKGGGSSSLQHQLAVRAATAASSAKKKKCEKDRRDRKRKPGNQLAKILTSCMGLSSKKKMEKERKARKRKASKEGDIYGRGDGSLDPPDPSGDSSEGSSSEQEEDDSSEDTDKEERRLEPPLRKRALKKPGSVLQLLVSHARAQLDQTSKVELTPGLEQDATQGVRLNSYFSICVKPTLGTALNQKRELHHLSLALDLLRQGELSGLGDLLAARFMAIHQSVVDQGWSAARHMELLPYEETAATTPSVVLQARKHAQLSNKVMYGEAGPWSGGGKGRPSKGKYNAWGDSEWQSDGKGKSKKGNKGKGKGKPSWSNKGQTQQDGDGKEKEKAA